jgi:Tfp pilus assembly protein PilN
MIYDINLVPKNKKNATGRSNFLIILIGLFTVVVLAVFFFLFPLQQKLSLMNQIRDRENELEAYSEVQTEYSTLVSEADQLNQILTTLASLKGSRVKMTTLMDDIEGCMPKNITMKSIKLEDGLLTIIGSASTYREISQFIVNLRKMEDVQDVTFTNATVEDDRNGTESYQGYNMEQLYDFTIYINYDYKNIIAELQQKEQAAMNEEVTDNEAD